MYLLHYPLLLAPTLYYSTNTKVSVISELYNLSCLHDPENIKLRGSFTVRLTSCLFCLVRLLCLYWINNSFTCLLKSKPVKQEVSRSVILPINLVFSAAPFVYLSPTYILTIKLSLLLGIVLEKYQKNWQFPCLYS